MHEERGPPLHLHANRLCPAHLQFCCPGLRAQTENDSAPVILCAQPLLSAVLRAGSFGAMPDTYSRELRVRERFA